MATVTIPMLAQATGLVGDEQLEIVQAGTSVRTTTAAIAGLAPASQGGFLTANLPSPTTVGLRYVVTDALVATFGSALVGGGSNVVPVYSTGSSWLVG